MLDAQLIEERLRKRAHDLRRKRVPAQPSRAWEDAGAYLPAPWQARPSRPVDGPGWTVARGDRCLDCPSQIAAERLAAVPDASRCVRCQRSFERDRARGFSRALRG